MQNVSLLRRPLGIPISVILAILSGVAPSTVADFVLLLSSALRRFIPNWVAGLSQTWLVDPWVWCVRTIVLFVWWGRRPSPRVIEPESADSPHR